MPSTRLLTAAAAAVALAAPAPALATSPPPNDNFGQAIAIAGASKPAPVPYEAAAATSQAGEPGIGDGAGTVWFKWNPNNAGATWADVCNGDIIHHVAVWRNTPGTPIGLANLQSAKTGDSAFLPEDMECRFHWRAAKGVTYYVQIDNLDTVWDNTLRIDQDASAPAAPVFDAAWGSVTNTSVTAKWKGEAGAKFVCALDVPQFTLCTSPKQLSNLKAGDHNLAVRAIDAHGNAGAPAYHPWKVDPAYTAPVAPAATDTTDTTDATAPVEQQQDQQQQPAGGDTTATPPVQTTPPSPAVCTLSLSAPKKATRAALRKGLRVKVTASGAACGAKLSLRQGRRSLRSRSVTLAAGATATLKLRTKAARRGKVTIAAGALKRTVEVV
jgi:ribosomal protein S12